jgi:hypothetical protein
MFLQKAWGIRNAYKHGTTVVDGFESASEGRGADWMALMVGHEWQHTHTHTHTHTHIYIYIYIYTDTVPHDFAGADVDVYC